MNPEKIINDWALASCETLENRDVEGHMNLISKQVKVYGLANHEFVDYKFWETQVKEQFSEGLVTSARYYLNSFRVENESLLVFTALEYLIEKDGNEHETPLEVVLFKEEDGVWRVTQQKILTKDEAQTAGLELNAKAPVIH